MDCVICLEALNIGDKLKLECCHEFHRDCLRKMRDVFCPLCKANAGDYLKKNGITIKRQESIFSYSYQTNDETGINALIRDRQFDPLFVQNIMSLDIIFNETRLTRALSLFNELNKYNLIIRYDSARSTDYIMDTNRALSLNRTVESAREMHWFYTHTDYPSIYDRLCNTYHYMRDRHAISEYAKMQVLKHYLLHINKFREAAPDTRDIRSTIDHIRTEQKQRKIITKWKGNLQVNVRNMITAPILPIADRLIDNRVNKFATMYAKNNCDTYITKDLGMIDELLAKETENYPTVGTLIIDKIKMHLKQHMRKYVKDNDEIYNISDDEYNSFSEYCRTYIDDHVNKLIAKKYNSKTLDKYLHIEPEEWNITDKYDKTRSYVRNYIKKHINDYSISYIIDTITTHDYEISASKYVKERIDANIEETIKICKEAIVYRIVSHHLPNLSKIPLDDKILYIKNKMNYLTPYTEQIIIAIFTYYLNKKADEIENEENVNYLQNNKNIFDAVRGVLKRNFYFSKKFNICMHTSAMKCPNMACASCCSGCPRHKYKN